MDEIILWVFSIVLLVSNIISWIKIIQLRKYFDKSYTIYSHRDPTINDINTPTDYINYKTLYWVNEKTKDKFILKKSFLKKQWIKKKI